MEISKIFSYHPPKDDQPDRYDQIRREAKCFAMMIDALCPDSPEKTIAIRKLQETVMYANASIAITESGK